IPSLAEVPNKHLDIKSQHKRFSSRLDEFIRLTHAVVVAPGGIGTLLELMYVWQLLQVGMLERRAVILLGGEFWGGLLSWMREQMLEKAFIGPHDFDFVRVVDDYKEAVALIKVELEHFQAAHVAAKNGQGEAAVAREALQRTAEVTQAAVSQLESAVAQIPARAHRRRANGTTAPTPPS